ncbi:MAG: hypothetical protein Tsb0015_14770 [Simkaniaceae bacterium]
MSWEAKIQDVSISYEATHNYPFNSQAKNDLKSRIDRNVHELVNTQIFKNKITEAFGRETASPFMVDIQVNNDCSLSVRKPGKGPESPWIKISPTDALEADQIQKINQNILSQAQQVWNNYYRPAQQEPPSFYSGFPQQYPAAPSYCPFVPMPMYPYGNMASYPPSMPFIPYQPAFYPSAAQPFTYPMWGFPAPMQPAYPMMQSGYHPSPAPFYPTQNHLQNPPNLNLFGELSPKFQEEMPQKQEPFSEIVQKNHEDINTSEKTPSFIPQEVSSIEKQNRGDLHPVLFMKPSQNSSTGIPAPFLTEQEKEEVSADSNPESSSLTNASNAESSVQEQKQNMDSILPPSIGNSPFHFVPQDSFERFLHNPFPFSPENKELVPYTPNKAGQETPAANPIITFLEEQGENESFANTFFINPYFLNNFDETLKEIFARIASSLSNQAIIPANKSSVTIEEINPNTPAETTSHQPKIEEPEEQQLIKRNPSFGRLTFTDPQLFKHIQNLAAQRFLHLFLQKPAEPAPKLLLTNGPDSEKKTNIENTSLDIALFASLVQDTPIVLADARQTEKFVQNQKYFQAEMQMRKEEVQNLFGDDYAIPQADPEALELLQWMENSIAEEQHTKEEVNQALLKFQHLAKEIQEVSLENEENIPKIHEELIRKIITNEPEVALEIIGLEKYLKNQPGLEKEKEEIKHLKEVLGSLFIKAFPKIGE